jgi:hypothetical protein
VKSTISISKLEKPWILSRWLHEVESRLHENLDVKDLISVSTEVARKLAPVGIPQKPPHLAKLRQDIRFVRKWPSTYVRQLAIKKLELEYKSLEDDLRKTKTTKELETLDGCWKHLHHSRKLSKSVPVGFSMNQFVEAWSPLWTSSLPSVPDMFTGDTGTGLADHDFEVHEVQQSMSSVKKRATGPDEISVFMIKSFAKSIPICNIICKFLNSVLAGRSDLSTINSVIVTMIPKQSNPESPLNFRPISAMSCVLAVFERCIYNRISQLVFDFLHLWTGGLC